MLIYFIRHGETERNANKRIAGSSDISLSEVGFKQGEKLAQLLSSIPFDGIYTSTLLRAVQTANLITKNHPAIKTAISDQRLQERDFGIYEGTGYENFDRISSGNIKAEDKVEEEALAQKRFRESIQEIIKKHGISDTIAITSHGQQIKSWISQTFSIDFPHLGNTSISIIERNGSDFKLIDLNNTNHLETST